MYKLIACDVDGTLLGSNFKATKADIEAIAEVQERGIIFSLCSGRSYKSLKIIAQDLGIKTKGNYIIGFNGGIIYDMFNSGIVKQDNLEKSIFMQIIQVFKQTQRNFEMVIYVDGEHVLFESGLKYAHIYQKTSRCNWTETEDILAETGKLDAVAKIIFIGENSALKPFETELSGHLGNEANVFFASDCLLETSPAESTKGNGVKWLCQKHGIDLSQVVAIGDNYNDLSMIKQAGLGVAVANAVPAAKEIADYITENDNTRGAVAEVINKFVLRS